MITGTDHECDRRPIRSRKMRVWIDAARWLARRGVSANTVSVVGMIAGLGAGAALAATGLVRGLELLWVRVLWILGGGLVQLRLLCNMLDGMVAMETGTPSPVGELYNEVPDRVSDMAVLIGLGYAASSRPELGYLAAALAVFVAYIRGAVRVAGGPSDFRGPMAKQQRMFVVTVLAAYMGLAPGSWQAAEWRGWTAPRAVLALICIGCAITVIRRLARASGILRSRSNA